MIDATNQLRFYVGLFVAMCAFMPLFMFSLLANQSGAPDNALVPVLIGAPINVAAMVLLVWGMVISDPSKSTRLLLIGTGLTVVGGAVIFGLRALIV